MTKTRVQFILTIAVTLTQLHMSNNTPMKEISPFGHFFFECEKLYRNVSVLLNRHCPDKMGKLMGNDDFQRLLIHKTGNNRANEILQFKKDVAAEFDTISTTSPFKEICILKTSKLYRLAFSKDSVSPNNSLAKKMVNTRDHRAGNINNPENTHLKSHKLSRFMTNSSYTVIWIKQNNTKHNQLQLQYIIIITIYLSYYFIEKLFRGENVLSRLFLPC